MEVLATCAVCRQKRVAEKMETWNDAPTCRGCYQALTSLYFEPGSPRPDDAETRKFINMASERSQEWLYSYEDERKKQEQDAHEKGVNYLRNLFDTQEVSIPVCPDCGQTPVHRAKNCIQHRCEKCERVKEYTVTEWMGYCADNTPCAVCGCLPRMMVHPWECACGGWDEPGDWLARNNVNKKVDE